jgi:hypothetical protein
LGLLEDAILLRSIKDLLFGISAGLLATNLSREMDM